jgi:hypothetical protein
VTWNQAHQRARVAGDELQKAQHVAADDGRPPTDNERRDLARVTYLIDSELRHLRQRAGITRTLPLNDAPDFSTRLQEALDLAQASIDVARNYRPGTEGAALSAQRQGVEYLVLAVAALRRAGMESVAS